MNVHTTLNPAERHKPMSPIQRDTGHLALAGSALHWLHTKSKRPIGNDWSAKPVASLDDLERSYRKGNNVGVRLGQWSEVGGLYLHIIDLDIRVADEKAAALEKLEELFPEINTLEFPTVISGSGGESRHFYFLSDRPFPSKKFAHSDGFAKVWDDTKQRDVKKWDWELHLLGTGAQAAIPPSIHPDTELPYRWLREFDFDTLDLGIGPIVSSDAVERVVGAQDEPGEQNSERQQPLGLSEDEIIGILDDLPPEEWFEDRDQWYRVGMALHHETGASDFGFETWCKYSKISEKFDEIDQRRVWRSFRDRAKAPFRMASLVAVVKEIRLEREFDDMPDFDDLESDDGEPTDMFEDLLGDTEVILKKPSRSQLKLLKEEVEIALGRPMPPKIARLNSRHAVARVSGKTVILDFTNDGQVKYGSVGDLHNFYENDRVAKEDTTEPVTKMWMRHKQRREYPNGIVFAPNSVVEGAYNHWQGFSVAPDDTKSCKLFLKHLFEVFCSGNAEHYEYMLCWLAHMIQFPEDKPGVAVIAKGKKGAGKDTVFEYIGKIFTSHYVTIATKDQFVGKFNAHQERCLLLHVQEGFWAGDKRDEGSLKYLITSHEVMIEPKGLNAFPVKSVLRVFISSNERWVVPASEDERRFFVLNVSDKRRGDHKYFAAFRAEMNSDGPAALLAYLMNYDISNFQVRDVPNTEALAEQKIEGLKNVERWWHSILEQGFIDATGYLGHGSSHRAWPNDKLTILKSDFRDAYSRWMRSRRYDGEEVSEAEFSKRLRHMLPEIVIGRSRIDGVRNRMFTLPDLYACRTRFEEVLGSELPWPEEQPFHPEDEPDDFDDVLPTTGENL